MRQFEPTMAMLSSLAYLLMNLTMSPHIEVETIYGKVRGGRGVARNGRVYAEFLGIPFAQPPMGQLRFEPPVPPLPWTGILDATNYRQACIQYEFVTHIRTGGEDCLTLNVFTNQINQHGMSTENLKPVIVYFYGGLFMSGFTSLYRAKYFMEEEIVLVTAAYRVNALGFLNTGDGLIRGNMGLKDQVMALRWVRENIRFFGGDPNLVTIMGQSSGGASTHFHLLSKMSSGLFHRAISMSGTALNPWAFKTNPKNQAIDFIAKVGCSSPSSLETKACLKSISIHKLIQAQREYLSPLADPITLFAPSVETIDDKDAFLVVHPNILLQNGTYPNHVPWMSGVTNAEGLLGSSYLLKRPRDFKKLDKDWNSVVSTTIFEDERRSNAVSLSKTLRKFYFGNRPISPETFDNITRFYSDALFYVPFFDVVTSQVKTSKAPIFLYYFTYSRDFGLANIMTKMLGGIPRSVDYGIGAMRTWFRSKVKPESIKRHGVCHSDELTLLFNIMTVGDEITPGSIDYEFSTKFVQLIAAFARDGKPGAFFGRNWNPATPDSSGKLSSLFELGDTPKVISIPFQKSIDLWRNLTKK